MLDEEGTGLNDMENSEKLRALKKRPLSVSIIAWILVTGGPYLLIMQVICFVIPDIRERMIEIMKQSLVAVPVPIQFTVQFITAVILFCAGLMMLKGRNWARLLYLVYGLVLIVYGYVVNPWPVMIVSSVVYMINTFFLLRPKVNEYFKAI